MRHETDLKDCLTCLIFALNPRAGVGQRIFTGQEYDIDTGLNYHGARYYKLNIGRFVSEDPAYLNLDRLEIQLADPQSWNSYSYARNNPLLLTDPNGEFWHIVAGAAIGALVSGGITYWQTGDLSQAAKSAAGGAVTGALIAAVGPAGFAANVATGSVANVAGSGVTRLLNGGKLNAGTTATDGAVGGVGGAIGYGIGKAIQGATQAISRPAAQETKLLNGPINLTRNSLQHVREGHTVLGKETSGNSIFYNGISWKQLVKDATQAQTTRQSTGTILRHVNAGKDIGTLGRANTPTNWYTVITKPNGDLITTFPGKGRIR